MVFGEHMKRMSTAALDLLVTLAARASAPGQRRQARRALLNVLVADGVRLGKAKQLTDVWIAERRAERRNAQSKRVQYPTVTAHYEQGEPLDAAGDRPQDASAPPDTADVD